MIRYQGRLYRVAATPVRIRYWSYPQKEDYPVELWEQYRDKSPSPTIDVEGLDDYVGNLQRASHVYRGMSEEEWRYIQETGQILSSCKCSFPTEGTCFSTDPLDAESYANVGRDSPLVTGRPTYLIEIAENAQMYRDTDGYVKCREAIPAEEITRVWHMFVKNEGLYIEELPQKAG